MKSIIICTLIALAGMLNGEAKKWNATPCTNLTCINKLMPTKNPYGRLDVEKYNGMTKDEQLKGRMCSGLAYAFTTNSKAVGIRTTLQYFDVSNITAGNALRGFDLYIKKGNEWYWAGSNVTKEDVNKSGDCVLADELGSENKECILYFPMRSITEEVSLLTDEGSEVKSIPSPFHGRVAVFGSSFTHGAGCSRCAMAYPAQLTRMTGVNFINMGFSGRCMLQQYFADALIEAKDIDAYVFDGFSNPSAEMVKQRLFPFIERFQKEKPGVPLIFMKTIWREKRHFRPQYDKKQAYQMAVADSMMRIAQKRYKDVYWVTTTNSTDKYHSTTTDGTHPDEYGYTLWAESVKKPIVKILRKYGIK